MTHNMKYRETLTWILDAPGRRLKEDAEYQINIDFVHSLGLKCDCVGWSKLDLSDPRSEEILEAITRFCKENGWTGRCLYDREYTDGSSDWYELVHTEFRDAACSERTFLPAENGGKLDYWTLLAYHETTISPKERWDSLYVPERFRDACIRNGIADLDFCWAKDKGRYAAAQYFQVFGNRPIPRMAIDHRLKKSDTARIQAAGGWLPRIAEVFAQIQQINLQDCYLAEDLPAGGIACAYVPRPETNGARHHILIHKDTAALLLREKAITPNALRPAPVMDSLPGGYVLRDAIPVPHPSADFMAQMQAEYEKLKASPRPVRMVSEKDALKVLRRAKKDRKDDFRKALPRAKLPELDGTDYAPLAPYYGVSNGGYLSDEYEFFPREQAPPETEAFFDHLKTEELLEAIPHGVVIGKCPDGDRVLLCRDGTLLRFSHEAPEVSCQWPTLAQFIFDAVTENE